MPDVEPSAANAYQVAPTITFSRARWNAVMASIAARLAAREVLEASFEALIAEGTQAALDLIQVNVGPQLETLTQQIAALEEQLEDIIGGGTAPNALLLGSQLPSFYLALANATGTLPVAQVSGVDALIAAAVAALVNSSPAQLDTLKELSDALGGDASFAANTAAAIGNRIRFDAAQALTGPQIAQALGNLGVSDFIKGLLNDADATTALTTLGATEAGRGLLTAANVAAQRTMLGGEFVISREVAAGDTVVEIPLPAGFDAFEVICVGFDSTQGLAARLDLGGGFIAGAGMYTQTLLYGVSSGVAAGASSNTFIGALTPTPIGGSALRCASRILIAPGSSSEYTHINWHAGGYTPSVTSHQTLVGSANINAVGRPTAILLFALGSPFTGTFILKGIKS